MSEPSGAWTVRHDGRGAVGLDPRVGETANARIQWPAFRMEVLR